MSNQNTEKSDKSKQTHFGYQTVDWDDKVNKVKGVFDNVAGNYDLMNDLMSLGIHRIWKKLTVSQSGVKKGDSVLDLAGGTGDLGAKFSPIVSAEGRVTIADINQAMLQEGRSRLIDKGLVHNIDYVQVNAESLPFIDNYFDCITIAFGLRNVTDKKKALKEMYRTLKPGGRLLILEFSKVKDPLLSRVYDTYSFSVLPWLGDKILNDSESYKYLAESIRMHPDQDALKEMVVDSGFDNCEYTNMTSGVVALHKAYKY